MAELDERLKKLDEDISNRGVETQKTSRKDAITGERVIAELIAGILFGLFVGFFLDDYFDTRPLFLLIFIILGLAGSFYNIYKDTVKISPPENSKK